MNRPHAVMKTGAQLVQSVSRRPSWEPLFLEALRAGASISTAARFAGVARRTAYDRRERHEEFASAWDAALEVSQRLRIRERTRNTNGSPDQLAARLRAVRHALDRRVFELEHSPALVKLRRVQEFASALRDARAEIAAVERLLDLQARDAHRAWVAAWREAHPEAA